MRIWRERAGTTWCRSPIQQFTCLAVMASSCVVCKQCFGARDSTVPFYKEMKRKELVITAEPVKTANQLEEIGISIEQATKYVCKICARKIAKCHQLYVEIARSLSLTRDIEAYPSYEKRKGAPPTHQQVWLQVKSGWNQLVLMKMILHENTCLTLLVTWGMKLVTSCLYLWKRETRLLSRYVFIK